MTQLTVELRKDQEYIELGNLLKIANIIPTGGYAKMFLKENTVYVNGEVENRRGRKVHFNDVVKVDKYEIIVK